VMAFIAKGVASVLQCSASFAIRPKRSGCARG
jgi:hypothetical protein